MNKDRLYMLCVALASALCVVWALSIPAHIMAILLALNTLISLYISAYRIK